MSNTSRSRQAQGFVHPLRKRRVAAPWIVHEDVGHGPDKPTVLHDRRTRHALHDATAPPEQARIDDAHHYALRAGPAVGYDPVDPYVELLDALSTQHGVEGCRARTYLGDRRDRHEPPLRRVPQPAADADIAVARDRAERHPGKIERSELLPWPAAPGAHDAEHDRRRDLAPR